MVTWLNPDKTVIARIFWISPEKRSFSMEQPGNVPVEADKTARIFRLYGAHPCPMPLFVTEV